MKLIILVSSILITGCASQPILAEEESPVEVENICERPENKETFVCQKKI